MSDIMSEQGEEELSLEEGHEEELDEQMASEEGEEEPEEQDVDTNLAGDRSKVMEDMLN